MRELLLKLAFLEVYVAAIAQLGERQTEDLEVPGSIPGLGIPIVHSRITIELGIMSIRLYFGDSLKLILNASNHIQFNVR